MAGISHDGDAPGRAAAWLGKQVELALAELDLTPPQYRVLGVLGEGASMPSALAERLAVRRPTITAVVEGLAARGLVERAPHDEDRRSVTHALTDKGEHLLREADDAVDARLRTIAGYGPQPADAMLQALELWRVAIRGYLDSAAQR
ncbi:MAG TPA: MarR family transcriptional regulator [Acidimicrobiales bacterium]|nr:MarR family transcriptional regulator [Acidimicrobiales bacterium]